MQKPRPERTSVKSLLTLVKAFESRPKFVTETSVLSVFEDFFV